MKNQCYLENPTKISIPNEWPEEGELYMTFEEIA